MKTQFTNIMNPLWGWLEDVGIFVTAAGRQAVAIETSKIFGDWEDLDNEVADEDPTLEKAQTRLQQRFLRMIGTLKKAVENSAHGLGEIAATGAEQLKLAEGDFPSKISAKRIQFHNWLAGLREFEWAGPPADNQDLEPRIDISAPARSAVSALYQLPRNMILHGSQGLWHLGKAAKSGITSIGQDFKVWFGPESEMRAARDGRALATERASNSLCRVKLATLAWLKSVPRSFASE